MKDTPEWQSQFENIMTNHRPMHFRDPILGKRLPRTKSKPMCVNMLYMFFTVVCICFVCNTGTFQKDAMLNSAFDVIRHLHTYPPLRRHDVHEEKQTFSKRHRQREKWSDKWFLRVVFTLTYFNYHRLRLYMLGFVDQI